MARWGGRFPDRPTRTADAVHGLAGDGAADDGADSPEPRAVGYSESRNTSGPIASVRFARVRTRSR